MFQRYGAISLALAVSMPTLAQEPLDRPYVALLDVSDRTYPSNEMKTRRRSIERQRDEAANACRSEEDRLQAQLESSRRGLNDLNRSSSRDTRIAADARNTLHSQIAALQRVLRDKNNECKHTIPTMFEIQLAKVQLFDQWPDRREQVALAIEQGRARQRKHGDVEDIGYRKFVEDQEKDIASGELAARQISSGKLTPLEVPDPVIRKYVQDLAAKIARSSDLKVPVHATMLDTSDINSVALPGGFIFVTSGLLLACTTEAEFVGVISQQIAHMAARHSTRASRRSAVSKMFVPAIQIATGLMTGGVSSAGAYYGMNYGFQGLGILVDRAFVGADGTNQKEADQLGIQYAWNAGFDPKGFIAFLDSLARVREFSRTDSFFLTKPALGERLLDEFTEIHYLGRTDHLIADSPEFRAVKERLRQAGDYNVSTF
jgi:Zn-dependent protease with chaperone function